jgi:hypothetical protein
MYIFGSMKLVAFGNFAGGTFESGEKRTIFWLLSMAMLYLKNI